MTLRLNGSTSGYTEIDAPAVAGSNTLVLPTGNGSSGQVLSTNGSGALSWTSDVMLSAGSASAPSLYFSGDTNTGMWSPAADTIAWSTGGTERIRLDNNGAVNTFGAPTDAEITSRVSHAAGTTYGLFSGRYSATSTSTGTNSFFVYTNGNVVNTNNSYGALSDIKLKENIVDASSQWNDLKALQVRKYNFREGQIHTQIGLIAQEVELVSPGLVTESPDRDAEGNDLGTTTKSVNYSVLYMKAVKALQEAMERIEALETRIAALEVTP